MLGEIYIEALLVDEALADEVWESWNNDQMSDLDACILWLSIAYNEENTRG